MVAVFQADEAVARALPCAACCISMRVEAHLQCDFHRGCAIRAEEAVAERSARQVNQALRQLDRRAVRGAGQHHVLQRVKLCLECRIDVRIGVTKQVDPPRTGAIQIALAVKVDQPRPLAACDGQRRHGIEPCVLRARMPDGRTAARLPRRVGRAGTLRAMNRCGRHGDGGIRHTNLQVATPAPSCCRTEPAHGGVW